MKKTVKTIFSLSILSASLACLNAHGEPGKLTIIGNGDTKQIDTVKKTIAADTHKLNTLEQKLRQQDIEVGQLENSLSKLNKSLAEENTILKSLKIKEASMLQSLESQREEFLTELQMQYVLGQHSALKLVLNQEDPALINRTLVYFSYINKERVITMSTLRENLVELVKTQAKTAEHIDNIKNLKTQRQDLLKKMQAQQKAQQALVAELNSHLKDAKTKLDALLSNQNNMESIVTNLDKKAKTKVITQPPLSFIQLKGKLPWPVQGALSEAFGSKIPDTPLLRRGVLLKAPEGMDVHAIYPGTVVFADWLRGFGLLIIIDHGNGYMSLYGRNESLKVEKDEHVDAGTVIAEVGKSGGFSTTGLYFEIRRNGEAINPAGWCDNTTL